MGTRGPVPKRSDQRIRRNHPSTRNVTVTEVNGVSVPELGLDDPAPLVVDWYASLAESAQARYFEPSDWQTARFIAHEMDEHVKSPRPSSQRFAALMSAMSELLVTEGSRRRVGVEIERGQVEQKASVSAIEDYKKLLSG